MPRANFYEEPPIRPLMDLLNVKQVALILGVSQNTIRMWVLNFQIEFIKVGGRVMFHPEVIQQMIAHGTRKAVRPVM
jgi:excisionase family DNA binding protein